MPERPDLVLKVSDNEAGRLDLYLTRHLKGYSRARVQALIRDGRVNIVGGRTRPSELLKRGARVEVRFPPQTS